MKKKKSIKTNSDNLIDISERLFESDYPSQITDSYWVFARCETNQEHYKKFKKNNIGKWLIFDKVSEIDLIWQKIKKATNAGLLGIGAKSATSKPNPNAVSQDEKVICIYTYNWQDIKDVYRVEHSLREIGIQHTLYYKTDIDTSDGKYKVKDSSGISKYISKGKKSYKKNSLSSLRGVKEERVEALKDIGIKNFDDLLSFDTSKKIQGVGVSIEYINKLKLLALSQIEGKIFKLSPFKFHEENILCFDIETDLYTKHKVRKIWSIALYHKTKVKHFYAKTFAQEKNILIDFLEYLRKYPDTPLYSYSSFDVSVLKYAYKRHKLDVNYFLKRNHFDLCALLKEHYILPLTGNGLKEVGRFFDYKFKTEYYNGLTAAREYMMYEGTGKQMSKELKNYIQDDVKVMNHIINKIKKHPDIKDIFDHPSQEFNAQLLTKDTM